MCQKLSSKILLPIQKPSKINPSVSSKSPQVIVVHAMQCCDHTDPPNNLLRFSVFCLLIVRHTYLLVRSTNIITTKQCDTLLNFRTVYTVQQPLCRSSIFLPKKKVLWWFWSATIVDWREDYFFSFGLWSSIFVVHYYVVVVRFVDVRVTAITSFLVFYCIPRIIPAFVIVVNVCICICFSIYLFGYYILFLEILDCNQVIYSLHLQSQNLTYASHFNAPHQFYTFLTNIT